MDVVDKVEILKPKSPIQKIAPELRRLRFKAKPQASLWVIWLERLKTDSQFLRQSVQIGFLVLTLLIGFQFFLWVKWVESDGNLWTVTRPPGVEAFLPISGLISLKYWITTGIINDIHPAGLFILIGVMAISLLFQKSFCSWVCPVGWISEKAWQLGKKVFGKNFQIPKWLDKVLRGIKYFLMAFFLWIIFFVMDTEAIGNFIQGPYNKVADIKMLYFFIHITETTAMVLLVLFLLSMVYKNFWCRYLCPYGALLGIFSRFSPVKVTRNVNSCIDCELCTRACPSFLPVHKLQKVTSEECTACVSCIEVCPVKDTLDLLTTVGNRKIPVPVFAALIAGVFFAIIGFAMLTGHWKNNISDQEYFHHIHRINGPEYTHF